MKISIYWGGEIDDTVGIVKHETQIPVASLLFVEQGQKLPVYRELYEIGFAMPPICVCKRGKRYEILDGNKRGRSAIAAGCKTINAVIY